MCFWAFRKDRENSLLQYHILRHFLEDAPPNFWILADSGHDSADSHRTSKRDDAQLFHRQYERQETTSNLPSSLYGVHLTEVIAGNVARKK